jgi:hypothetical protein
MNLRNVVLAGALSVSSATAMAVDIKGEWALGYDFGGDNIADVPLTSGETITLSAGDGFYVKGGISMPLDVVKDLELIGLIGWKYTGVNGTNGSVDVSRFPLDIGLRYTMDVHHFGAAITTDMSIDFSGSGAGSGYGTKLESQLGISMQYEYVLASGMGIGARYTSLKYDAPDINQTYDASSFGIVLSGSF